MSRFWYLVGLLILVLIVWLYLSQNSSHLNDEDQAVPPTYQNTIGFDTMIVDSRVITLIYNGLDSVKGLRVYNAWTSSTVDKLGLVVAALNYDSSEVFNDGKSFYIPIDPDGGIQSPVSREEASRMVMAVVNDTNYVNLITSFHSATESDFWNQRKPDFFFFAFNDYQYQRAKYPNLNILYTPSNNVLQGSVSMQARKLTIRGEPCPPHCPFSGNFLYEIRE